MLATHAFDIAVIISSPIASLRFTFVDIFKISSSSYVMHWLAELETKVYDPRKEKGRTDRPTEGSTERVNSLAHLTPNFHSAKWS